MIIKKVTQVGNPNLRRKSKTVKNIINNSNQTVIRNLIDSIGPFNLVGMAAPQIGVNKRILITKIMKTKFRSPSDVDRLRVFVNPKIQSKSKKVVSGYEGCGSVAESGLFASIPRYQKITVKASNENGDKFVIKASGLLARVIQHEIDRLDGKIFLDKLKNSNTLMSRSEYLKAKNKKLI